MSSSLPTFSGRDVTRVFEKFGWQIGRRSGSHIILEKEGHSATLSMSRIAEQIEAEVLQLSADERARLAEHILASLESEPTEDPEAIEAAWVDEANRRYDEYLRGARNRSRLVRYSMNSCRGGIKADCYSARRAG